MAMAEPADDAIPQLGVASQSNQFAIVSAALVALALVTVTVVVHSDLGKSVVEIKPFVPVVATIWCFAELLTAFILLSQFYVGGKTSFAMIAAGYGVAGLMAIPYSLCFPNTFTDGPYTLGDLQVSPWLWTVWHLAFPISIAAAHLIDGTLDKKSVPRHAISATLTSTVVGCLAFTIAISSLIYFGRDHLPVTILADGHFSARWGIGAQPIVILVNTMCLGIMLVRARRLSPLQMWLAIAVLTMTLDALVNFWSPQRYSPLWYLGKCEALLTSTTLLTMLLIEIATLYRRLYDAASVDTLTGLPNRRRFNESLGRALGDGQQTGIALLMLDIDKFKEYNDRYGHPAGDVAIATVASSLQRSLLRQNDFVARFGGEEFVILLPDVVTSEVSRIAERVRERVARLRIEHESSPTEYLTISIGAAFSPHAQTVSAGTLFEYADEALYAAKAKGRNCVVVSALDGEPRSGGAPAYAR